MRRYAKNSPKAAARFLVLASLSDGDLDRLELGALEHFPALKKLGIDRSLIETVLSEICADIPHSPCMDADFKFEFRAGDIGRLLADVDRSELQRSLCRAALSVPGVDQRVRSGEAILLWAALDAWDLQLANMLRSPSGFIPTFVPAKNSRLGYAVY